MSERSRVIVFLSSPTDVQPEREAAERVVSRLGGVYATHVEFVLERWEHRFYEASKGFQEAIAAMETFDLVVGILWKRVGSELPPDRFVRSDGSAFESGTVYEIETALAASRRSGQPAVYVFKSTRPVTFTEERVEEERAQKRALDEWWARTFRDEAGHYVAATNSFSTTEDFETKLEDFLVSWLEEKGHIPRGPVWDLASRGSPYPGLVAYDRDRSPVFFGRQLAVEQARDELLAAAAREGGLPVLFVIGASGSGKSSLVRAGLLPQLTRLGAVPGVDLWWTALTVPAADSLAPLATQLYPPDGWPELAAGAQSDPERWASMAAGSPEAAADSVAWALDRAAEAEGRRVQADRKLQAGLLLVVDQLESLFGTPGQGAFTKVLRALVDGGRVWLLATLRSDRYADLQLDPDLLALKRAGATYDLPPPGPAEIADVVKGPARAAGLTFAERDGQSLARVLVEAAPNADALPLLQMALAQLFEGRQGRELTFDAYQAMGGVEGAIATHANAVFGQLPPDAQRELDPLVRALVRDVRRTSDGEVRFTAQSASRRAFETSAARQSLVATLVEARLLVSDGGNLRVGHEALLRRWDRARAGLERIADAELRRERRRRQVAAAIAGVFLLVAIGAGVATYFAIENADAARAALASALRAESRRLAPMAEQARQSGEREDAILLARYALTGDLATPQERPYTAEAAEALVRALDPYRAQVLTLPGPADQFAVFVHDDAHVLTMGAQGRFAIWDAATGTALFEPQDLGVMIRGVDVARDGASFLTAGSDGLARLWDGKTGKEIRSFLHERRQPIFSARFSADGERIATASYDGTARIWSIEGQELKRLPHAAAHVTAAVFGLDDAYLVTAALNPNAARIWNVASGEPVGSVIPYDDLSLRARSLAISADRAYVAIPGHRTRAGGVTLPSLKAGSSQSNLEWPYGLAAIAIGADDVPIPTFRDEADFAKEQVFAALAHPGLVAHAKDDRTAYGSPLSLDRSRLLVIVGDDASAVATVWDVPSQSPVARLPGDGVTRASFNADGTRLVTGTEQAATIWSVAHPRSRNVWDLRKAPRPPVNPAPQDEQFVASVDCRQGVTDAICRADGALLLTYDGDRYAPGEACIWDTASDAPIRLGGTGLPPTPYSLDLSFSADGARIVLKELDGVRVWDQAGREITEAANVEPAPAAGADEVPRRSAKSADGSVVVSSDGRSVRVERTDGAEPVIVLEGHAAEVNDVAFRADAGLIVTASTDRTARIWEATTGRLVDILDHGDDGVLCAAFDAGGDQVLTANSAGVVTRWDVSRFRTFEDVLSHAAHIVPHDLSDAERRAHGIALD